MALWAGLDDRPMNAMDQSVQKELLTGQGSSRDGECWPWYIDSNLSSKQFFVTKSLSYEPRTMHMKGLECTGHEGNPLYGPINAYIPALIGAADYANAQHDTGSAWHYLRCSRFFEAYLDATCSHIALGDVTHNEKIDALESMIKIFPKIDSASRTQWHCSAAYQNAVGMLGSLAQHDNVRAQSILANLYASMAEAGPEYKSAVGALIHTLFDSKTDGECREIMLAHDLRAAFSVCDLEHDAKLCSLFQGFLYERGTAEERSKAYEYCKQAAGSDLLAKCYYLHGQLSGLEQAPALSVVSDYLDRLMATEAGRQVLPIFMQLCDEKMMQLFKQIHKTHNCSVDKIRGLVSYSRETGCASI